MRRSIRSRAEREGLSPRSGAAGALGIGDRFEILDMGEAEDAADHFGAGEGETVLENHAHEARALPLDRRAVFGGGEQARDIGVARRGCRHSARKRPWNPAQTSSAWAISMAIGVARMRLGFVALLREKGEEEIADHSADVEADRPDEGEFGIDDARVVGRQHDRAGMQIAMDQRLGAGHEWFPRLRGDFQRAVAFESLLLRVEIGAGPAISGASR